MELWSRLRHLELTWIGFWALVAAFFAVLLLRRLLPAGRRHRGRISLVLLGAAPFLHLLGTALDLIGAPTLSAGVHLMNILVVITGVTGTAGMLIFDILLGRSLIPTNVRDLAQFIVFAAIIIAVLRTGNIDPLSVLTTSAVLTAVIGLALQSIISNVLAGLVLHVDRAFILGDWIQIGTAIGRISEITWRSAELITPEGDTTIIPNADLLSSRVVNLSRPTPMQRSVVRVPFSFRHSPGEVAHAVGGALRGVKGVLADPPSRCAPVDFLREDLIYAVSYWVVDVGRAPEIEGEVRARIWYAAQRAGLQGPCPAGPQVEGSEVTRRLALLRKIDLFAPLGEPDIASLAAAMNARRFAEGETILEQGDPGSSLFVIESGAIRVTRAGRELGILHSDNFFGERSLLSGEPRNATCTAIDETLCFELGSAALRAMLAGSPALAEKMSAIVSSRGPQPGDEAEPEDRSARRQTMEELWARVRAYLHLD